MMRLLSSSWPTFSFPLSIIRSKNIITHFFSSQLNFAALVDENWISWRVVGTWILILRLELIWKWVDKSKDSFSSLMACGCFHVCSRPLLCLYVSSMQSLLSFGSILHNAFLVIFRCLLLVTFLDKEVVFVQSIMVFDLERT